MWKLVRAGTAPGADRRRTMRWERLGEVLRELDEFRERGEPARPAGVASAAVTDGSDPAPVPGTSVGEPGGGDPVGS